MWTLRNAYTLRKSKSEVKHLKEMKRELINGSGMYRGESETMKRLRDTVEKVAVTDANVLITGENGTGKEMLAREIHKLSYRRNELMVPVDMGAISAEIAENIFLPFFTTKEEGSGIGLSISRQIMRIHGGSLRLTSNSDDKVTFTLLFG